MKSVSPDIKWFPSTYAADEFFITQFASGAYGDCRSAFLELWKGKTMADGAGRWKRVMKGYSGHFVETSLLPRA